MASLRLDGAHDLQASNLNYALNVAVRVEEIMNESGGQVTDPVEVRTVMLLGFVRPLKAFFL